MMNYNKSLVNKFRALAVTDVKDLKIGNIYYSNFHGYMRIVSIDTEFQFHARENRVHENDDNENLAWFSYLNKNGKIHTASLHDNNVGFSSYNPWLIFENENLMNVYKEMLVITYEHDYYDYYDYYD